MFIVIVDKQEMIVMISRKKTWDRLISLEEYVEAVYDEVLGNKGKSKQMNIGFMWLWKDYIDADDLLNIDKHDAKLLRRYDAINKIIHENENTTLRTKSKMIRQLNV